MLSSILSKIIHNRKNRKVNNGIVSDVTKNSFAGNHCYLSRLCNIFQ